MISWALVRKLTWVLTVICSAGFAFYALIHVDTSDKNLVVYIFLIFGGLYPIYCFLFGKTMNLGAFDMEPNEHQILRIFTCGLSYLIIFYAHLYLLGPPAV